MTFKQEDIDALLPLPPATFRILMAVAEEDRHGYAIIQDIALRTNNESAPSRCITELSGQVHCEDCRG